MGGGEACEPCHWGIRWSSLWGHEACARCADMCAVGVRQRSHQGLRLSPQCGHETCVWGVGKWVQWARANAATVALGGFPRGATERVKGVPKSVRWARVDTSEWAFVGAPL
eukprot:3474867-Pyramimonas_sp.AAC.2